MNVPDPGACSWEQGPCQYRGVALVERFDGVPGNPVIAEPSGVWRWLCGDHAKLDLGL